MNMMWIKLKTPKGALLVNMAHVTSVYSDQSGQNFIRLVTDEHPFEINEDVDKIWLTISETMKLLQGSRVLDQTPGKEMGQA